MRCNFAKRANQLSRVSSFLHLFAAEKLDHKVHGNWIWIKPKIQVRFDTIISKNKENLVSNEVLKLKQELQVREQKYLEVFSDREALKETVMTLKDLAKDLEQTMKGKVTTVSIDSWTLLLAKDNAFKDKCGVIEKLEQKIQEFESQIKDQLSEIERLEVLHPKICSIL